MVEMLRDSSFENMGLSPVLSVFVIIGKFLFRFMLNGIYFFALVTWYNTEDMSEYNYMFSGFKLCLIGKI